MGSMPTWEEMFPIYTSTSPWNWCCDQDCVNGLDLPCARTLSVIWVCIIVSIRLATAGGGRVANLVRCTDQPRWSMTCPTGRLLGSMIITTLASKWQSPMFDSHSNHNVSKLQKRRQWHLYRSLLYRFIFWLEIADDFCYTYTMSFHRDFMSSPDRVFSYFHTDVKSPGSAYSTVLYGVWYSMAI